MYAEKWMFHFKFKHFKNSNFSFSLTLVMLTFKRTKWFVIALCGFASHGAIDVKTGRQAAHFHQFSFRIEEMNHLKGNKETIPLTLKKSPVQLLCFRLHN